MNKKVIWVLVVVLILIVGGIVGYMWGTKKGSETGSTETLKALLDRLNLSEARVVESCSTHMTAGNYRIIDVGGKYSGLWSQDGSHIVGVCSN